MIRIEQYVHDYKSLEQERRNLLKRAAISFLKLLFLAALLIITFSLPGINYVVAFLFVAELVSMRVLFCDMEIKYYEEVDSHE